MDDTDLEEANEKGSLKWTKAKSYRELFGVNRLDVESLNNVIDRMFTDDELFRAYYQDLNTYGPHSSYCKDKTCRVTTLCSMNYTLVNTTYACTKRYL